MTPLEACFLNGPDETRDAIRRAWFLYNMDEADTSANTCIYDNGCSALQTDTEEGYVCDLPGYIVKHLIPYRVEFDEDCYLLTCDLLGLYSTGSDIHEALENLKDNIASLYVELMEDDKRVS